MTTHQYKTSAQQSMSGLFDGALQGILDFTPFREEWESENIGSSGVVRAELPEGSVIKTEAPDGRRLIIVGTSIGAVALAEVFIPGSEEFALRIHAPLALHPLLAVNRCVGQEEFFQVVGKTDGKNIGHTLQYLEAVMGVYKRVKTRAQEREEEFQVLGLHDQPGLNPSKIPDGFW